MMIERQRYSHKLISHMNNGLISDSPTKRIYEAVKKIPYGKVATYSQIAKLAGNSKMSRAVGNALHKNRILTIYHATEL